MQGSNSSLFIEQLIREVVRDLGAFAGRALEQVGYGGPHQRIALTAEQDAFLAGYLHGAVVRMLGFGEQVTDRDVERAAADLHRRLFGAFEMDGRMRHASLVREGVDHFRNPQVYLGYSAGHQDALRLLQCSDYRSTLGPALANLGRPGTVASVWN
jgi:hypothetical protein